jgi:hypothetical protein
MPAVRSLRRAVLPTLTLTGKRFNSQLKISIPANAFRSDAPWKILLISGPSTF